MADITTRCAPVYQDGDCGKSALIAVKNATSGDTVDLSAWFSVIKRAGLVSVSGTTIAGVTISNNPGGLPTLCTIPAGVAADGVWLIIVGVDS